MPTLRAILDRFRPAPPPGRPSPIGVPSAIRYTPADELAPLFPVLDSIEAECAVIRADADRRAREISQGAAKRAAQIGAAAGPQADEARAGAEVAMRAAVHQQSAAVLAAAQREADDLYATGLSLLPERVAAAVATVWSIAAPTVDGGGADAR